MKKLIFISLFLLMFCGQALALITTDNVDRDRFQYVESFMFSTFDLMSNNTEIKIPIMQNPNSAAVAENSFYYVIYRGGSDTVQGRVVGISVASNGSVTAGGATFDVTINDAVTGVQAILEPGVARAAVGNTGSGGEQYAYMNQDRTDDVVHKGLNIGNSPSQYNRADYPYGKATPLSAGNRIGLKVTTSSSFLPTGLDVVATVYVLE